ncbi:MAG: tetratricopeptide repeat protein [Syntrophomonadaceae bacterium]
MRAYVFTDRSLARRAGQFVWLSIDTEKTGNADFQKKYPIRAWPSFYVIDPNREAIVLRWVGGATVAELNKFFDEGVRAVRGRAGGGTALAKADALYSEGKYAESVSDYEEALKTLPKASRSYPRAVESLLFALATTRQSPHCVAVATEALPAVRGSAAAAAVAGSGLDCALRLPPDDPQRGPALAAFEKEARAILADPTVVLAADDRSALYGSLFDARQDAKDEAGAHTLALEWVADLDAAERAAKTPEQKTALDPNRLNAYDAAGEIQRAIPMLERSEKDFPQDYNPPARLALVYLKLKKYPEALAASDRALARVYGPRKLRVLAVRTDIYTAMGDAKAARKTLQDSLAYAEALPAGQRSEATIEDLKKKLGATE